MKLGFIGFGSLGVEIAKRIRDGGYDLVCWNRTLDKPRSLGFEVVDSPKDLADIADVIFVIVFDSDASREVIFGSNGLIEGNLSGKVIVDMTTNDVDYVVEAGKSLAELGVCYLDAPILGSVIPARKGELTLLVGGSKEKFDELFPIFQRFAKVILHVGEIGDGTKLKLINNIVLGGFMEVIAEAVSLGEKVGFSKDLILEVLSNGAGKSMILDVKREKLLREDFSTHFSVNLIYKDLYYVTRLAYKMGGSLPATSVIKEIYSLCKNNGLGELDFSAVYKLFK